MEGTIFKGTTPTIIFDFTNDDLDFDYIDACTLTLSNGTYNHVWDKNRIVFNNEEKTARIVLTQEETRRIPVGLIKVQFKFKDRKGKVFPTYEKTLKVLDILDKGVI